MTALGIFLTAASAGLLIALFWWAPHQRPYPSYGYLGLAVMAAGEWTLFRGSAFTSQWMTPVMWTGYIAVADAAVYCLAGESLLHNYPRTFFAVAAVSTPLWLIFEAYNLRLLNWEYIHLPGNVAVRYFGYAWAFATIWPGMLETACLLRAAGLWRRSYPPVTFSTAARGAFVVAGALMLAIPLLLPRHIAAYLFGLVWGGFIFLLDPINSWLGVDSFLDDLREGRRARFYSLLLSGLICGFLWEFWNYWAYTKWVYIFPILQDAKIFEMPVPGFLGFPPFALEYFCMYVFLAALVQRIGRTRFNYVPNF